MGVSWSYNTRISLLFLLPAGIAVLSWGMLTVLLTEMSAESSLMEVAGGQRVRVEELAAGADMIRIDHEEHREPLRDLVERFSAGVRVLSAGGPLPRWLRPPVASRVAERRAALVETWAVVRPALLDVARLPLSDPRSLAARARVEAGLPELARAAEDLVAAVRERSGARRRHFESVLVLLGGLYLVVIALGVRSVRRFVRERERSERTLREAREYAEGLVHSSLDMIVSTDLDGRIVVFNEAARQEFGYTEAEALSQPVSLLYADEDQARRVLESLSQRGVFVGEVTNRRQDGRTFPALVSASILKDDRSRAIGIVSVSRNATPQKAREEALKIDLSLRRLREHILAMKSDKDWEEVAGAFRRELANLVSMHACGINLVDPARQTYVANYVDEDGLHQVRHSHVGPSLRQALETQRYVYRRNPAEMARFEDDATLVERGVRSVVDVPFAAGTIAVNSLEEDAFGEREIGILGRFAEVMDEARRRLCDLETLARRDRQLRQAQRLEVTSQLAVGVAHEINNPLTSVLGYSQLLLKRGLDPDTAASVRAILAAGERAQAIVGRLLDFVRSRATETHVLDLNSTVSAAIELVRYPLSTRRIQLVTDLTPDLPPVRARPGDLQQVVLHLVQNSAGALAQQGLGGQIRVATRTRDGWVCIEVSDDGPGIPPEVAERVFDPFYTTAEVGTALGLGLSECLTIAHEHGGDLHLETCERGACVVLELPAASTDGPASPARPASRPMV